MREKAHQPIEASALLRQSLTAQWREDIERRMQRISHAQREFLAVRRSGLAQVAQLIAAQIPVTSPIPDTARQPVMDSRQLDAFGAGSLVDCLGPAYAVYEGRRVPRIPNGALKLVSRVMELSGEPGNFRQPASILTQYDMPLDPWFLTDSAYSSIPCAIWMEMALQPCGILSAWAGTMLQAPDIDFYFRNLDGWAEVLHEMDLRGQIISARANLLSSISTGDTIIQKYSFELSCAGVPLYHGESSFGYFSPQAMAKQLGLDNGRRTRPAISSGDARWLDLPSQGEGGSEKPVRWWPAGKLSLLDRATVNPAGGNYGKGYVYASKMVNAQDWFFACHFYQDPVMPGSLGVEAILQALRLFAIEAGLTRSSTMVEISLPLQRRINWKYRGQITPAHRQMELEAHIVSVERRGNQTILQADASLWVDSIRIYEVKQAAISLVER